MAQISLKQAAVRTFRSISQLMATVLMFRDNVIVMVGRIAAATTIRMYDSDKKEAVVIRKQQNFVAGRNK